MGQTFPYQEQSPSSWNQTGFEYPDSEGIIALLILVLSSVLIYTGGMITNDLFDVEVDRKERPSRPLASGKIKKRIAALLAILFLGGGMVLATLLNPISVFISILLVGMVLLYNYRVKDTVLRPHLMASIRALNVFYGSSFYIYYFLFLQSPISSPPVFSSYASLAILITVSSSSVFIHIFSLTFLSRSEAMIEISQKPNLKLKRMFFLYVICQCTILILGMMLLPFKWFFLVVFGLFVILVCYLFYKKMRVINLLPNDIIYLVKNMLFLLVVLDSAFVMGSGGLYPGLFSMLLIIPSVILSKRIHMT